MFTWQAAKVQWPGLFDGVPAEVEDRILAEMRTVSDPLLWKCPLPRFCQQVITSLSPPWTGGLGAQDPPEKVSVLWCQDPHQRASACSPPLPFLPVCRDLVAAGAPGGGDRVRECAPRETAAGDPGAPDRHPVPGQSKPGVPLCPFCPCFACSVILCSPAHARVLYTSRYPRACPSR